MDTIKDNWNSMARAYEAFNCSPDSYSYQIEWPTIQKILPEVRHKKVLDIGCGTGIFTFLLEQYAPAKLVGVDISEGMLEIAKEKASAMLSNAIFIQGDASRPDLLLSEKYDLIFSSTTLHYIEALPAFFEGLRKCTADNGTVILSVIHPIYSAQYPVKQEERFPEDDDWRIRYLDPSMRAYVQPWLEYNDNVQNQLSQSYHHLFCDYINAAVNAGFKIGAIEEPMPPQSWKSTAAFRYESYIETPTYLILKLTL